MGWVIRLEEFASDRPWRAIALVLLTVGLCAAIPIVARRALVSIADAQAKHEADVRAIARHQRWLRSLPDAEKARWPVVAVCHPPSAPHGDCACEDWDRSVVGFTELLPNGTVVCHEMR